MITEITMRFRPVRIYNMAVMECEILNSSGNIKVYRKELHAEVDEMHLRAALDAFKASVLKAAGNPQDI